MKNNQTNQNGFKRFNEFYPYYLNEHRDLICRRLHFVGSALVLLVLAFAIFAKRPMLLLLIPVIGYGFAWIGHFFFEKNRPATFQYPVYSLIGDWVMFKDILVGKLKW